MQLDAFARAKQELFAAQRPTVFRDRSARQNPRYGAFADRGFARHHGDRGVRLERGERSVRQGDFRDGDGPEPKGLSSGASIGGNSGVPLRNLPYLVWKSRNLRLVAPRGGG